MEARSSETPRRRPCPIGKKVLLIDAKRVSDLSKQAASVTSDQHLAVIGFAHRERRGDIVMSRTLSHNVAVPPFHGQAPRPKGVEHDVNAAGRQRNSSIITSWPLAKSASG
jgi:hypothetical protein